MACGVLLTAFAEVARLPGCSAKIAELFQQWKSSGHLEEALEAASDSHISVLKVFYEIWGVGDTTAREFYRKGMLFQERRILWISHISNGG